MENEAAIYFLLLVVFVAGSIYNFRIRKQCIYKVKLTKPRTILLIIIPLIFFSIAYIWSNAWDSYILVLSASILIISSLVGEGIHEKGIYYHYGRRVLARLAKWEDIKNIKIYTNKNKLKSFKIKTTTMFPDQYYSPEDIKEIEKFIEKMRKDY